MRDTTILFFFAFSSAYRYDYQPTMSFPYDEELKTKQIISKLYLSSSKWLRF